MARLVASSSPARRPRRFVVVRTPSDPHPAWTVTALAGTLIALSLAVFGLPHADLHGPLHYLGVMDPFCGGTRSVYLALHGRLREAVLYNPAGPLLVVAALAILVRASAGWLTGAWLTVKPPRVIVAPVLFVTLVMLEINQQSHAALLMQPWSAI
jgi:hypothetical protein